MTIKPLPQEFIPFAGKIRKLKLEDLPHLRPILETWIRNSDTKELLQKEVEETLQNMEGSISGENERHYLIAENESSQVVGVVGLKKPDDRMIPFSTTSNPTELVNFFVASSERGKGVGKALAKSLEDLARTTGHTEIILNSGPRYKETAWEFYDKLPGYKRVGIAKKYYGDRDAVVWQKIL